MNNSNRASFYFVKDIKEMLQVSEATAYRFIRELNKELKEQGYLTVAGRVPQDYFNKRYYHAQ